MVVDIADSQEALIAFFSTASPVVLVVLALLLAFSIVSWAIIALKLTTLRIAVKESKRFLDIFFATTALDKVFAESEELRHSSLAKIFRAGYIAFKSLDGRSDSRQAKMAVLRAIKQEANAENKQLATLVPFLATVGNTAPFIGLFGTVWGIMTSFHTIGLMQSASLAAVAPGISEALIATAVGLAAAIPAVMGYNYCTQKLAIIERDIEEFAPEFVAALLNEPHIL